MVSLFMALAITSQSSTFCENASVIKFGSPITDSPHYDPIITEHVRSNMLFNNHRYLITRTDGTGVQDKPHPRFYLFENESKAYVSTAFQFELFGEVVTIAQYFDTSNTLSTETFKLCIDINLPDSLEFPKPVFIQWSQDDIVLEGHHFGLLNDIFCLNNTYINSDLSCVTTCPSGLIAFGAQFSGRACLENGTECDIAQGCRPLTPGCTKSIVTSTTSELCRLCEPPRELYNGVCNQPTTPDTTAADVPVTPASSVNVSSSSSSDSNDPVVIGASVGAAAVVIGGGAAAYFLYYRGAAIGSNIYKSLL